MTPNPWEERGRARKVGRLVTQVVREGLTLGDLLGYHPRQWTALCERADCHPPSTRTVLELLDQMERRALGGAA